MESECFFIKMAIKNMKENIQRVKEFKKLKWNRNIKIWNNKGKRDGNGTFYELNGDYYIGNHKLGRKDGKGQVIIALKFNFNANWKLISKNAYYFSQKGKGTLYSKNGDILYDGKLNEEKNYQFILKLNPLNN